MAKRPNFIKISTKCLIMKSLKMNCNSSGTIYKCPLITEHEKSQINGRHNIQRFWLTGTTFQGFSMIYFGCIMDTVTE